MNTRPGFAVEATRQTAAGQRSPKAGERAAAGDNGFRDLLAERSAKRTDSQQPRDAPGTHDPRRPTGTNDKAGDDGQKRPRDATVTRAKHAADAQTAGRETQRPAAGSGDRRKTEEDHAGPNEPSPVAASQPAQPVVDPAGRGVTQVAANDRNDARRVDADTRSLRDRQRTDGTAAEMTSHPERRARITAEPRSARISGPANPATAETRAIAARPDAGHARQLKASASNESSRAEARRSVADLDRHTAAAAWDKAVFDAGARLQSDAAKSTLANFSVQANKSKAGTVDDLTSSLGHSFQTHAALQSAAPGQTPTMAGAASASAVVTASLYAAPGTEQWSRAITQQSLRLAHQAGGQAELTLHPPSLGKLQVSVQMGHDAQLHFASPHPDVRAAVQSALPQLKNAFAEAGLALGQASVGDQNPRQSNADQHGEGSTQTGAIGADTETGEPVPDLGQITRIVGRTTLGGIDIFA